MARRDRRRQGEVDAKLVEAPQVVGEALLEREEIVLERAVAVPVLERAVAVPVLERAVALSVGSHPRGHRRWIDTKRQSEENARALVTSRRGRFMEGGPRGA